MKNKVTVSIAGQNYTLVASEDAGYMEKVAAHVDAKIQEVLDESKVSLVDGAVLGALNIADEYFKEVEASENLRRQLKEYLEEATKMKMELSEAKREIFKLQNKKQATKGRGSPLQGRDPGGRSAFSVHLTPEVVDHAGTSRTRRFAGGRHRGGPGRRRRGLSGIRGF